MISSWKTTYYETTTSPLDFTVTVDGKVIYQGRAVSPDGSTIQIDIADIAADYLTSEISIEGKTPSSIVGTYTSDAVKTFYLRQGTSGSGTLLATYDFAWNATYKDESVSTSQNLNNPVNGRYISGGISSSSYSTSNGYSTTISRTSSGLACKGRYQILYSNLKGGYDTFLFEGKSDRGDDYTNYTVGRKYDNSTSKHGTVRYAAERKPTWTLRTGYLTDSQSEVFADNILSSGHIWLIDIELQKVYPVVITEQQVTWSRRSNGRLAVYSLNVEGSQTEAII